MDYTGISTGSYTGTVYVSLLDSLDIINPAHSIPQQAESAFSAVSLAVLLFVLCERAGRDREAVVRHAALTMAPFG